MKKTLALICLNNDDIDWSRTKAYTSWNPGIFINLKGREPNGIVEYSEYEKLRDFIIAELKKLEDRKGSSTQTSRTGLRISTRAITAGMPATCSFLRLS